MAVGRDKVYKVVALTVPASLHANCRPKPQNCPPIRGFLLNDPQTLVGLDQRWVPSSQSFTGLPRCRVLTASNFPLSAALRRSVGIRSRSHGRETVVTTRARTMVKSFQCCALGVFEPGAFMVKTDRHTHTVLLWLLYPQLTSLPRWAFLG